jgi:hypothetical protein
MKRHELEALAERLFARSISRLPCDQPELRLDLKVAAGLIFLLARLPEIEIDVPPPDHSAPLRSRSSSH